MLYARNAQGAILLTSSLIGSINDRRFILTNQYAVQMGLTPLSSAVCLSYNTAFHQHFGSEVTSASFAFNWPCGCGTTLTCAVQDIRTKQVLVFMQEAGIWRYVLKTSFSIHLDYHVQSILCPILRLDVTSLPLDRIISQP